MEEEDEYDYDIYDEADSGSGDDVAPRPPSPPSGNPGMNCIKIGLPGKVILSKRKGLRESPILVKIVSEN